MPFFAIYASRDSFPRDPVATICDIATWHITINEWSKETAPETATEKAADLPFE